MATGLSASRRPRRQAGSQGRSQVRPRMPGNTLDSRLSMYGVGVPALRDQPDVFGNVGVGRTGPLAIDYFVKVVRIAGISWMHSPSNKAFGG